MAITFTLDDITHVQTKKILNANVDTASMYLQEVEDKLSELAIQFGVVEADMVLGYTLKKYLSSFITYRVCEDRIGLNNVEITDDDMYIRMAEQFKDYASVYYNSLTPSMLLGISETPQDMSPSVVQLWRTA